MFEKTQASPLVSCTAFRLLPTNAAKAGLSISMPSSPAQIYSSSDSRADTAPLLPSQQGSAGGSCLEC